MRNQPRTGTPKATTGEVGVLNKTLNLIEAMATADRQTVAELSASAGVNKAAAYRILHTLERRGYATRDSHEVRRYSLGPAFRSLVRDAGSPRDLLVAARPVLNELWAEYGETTNLGIMTQDRVLYLDILESDQGLRTTVTVGSLDYLHSTALGKAMLAALPASEARMILTQTERVARTPGTIISLPEMMADRDRVRERGYALDDEESESGARCIASAVLDTEGRPVAAVSVSGPTWRLPDDMVDKIGHHLSELCATLGSGRTDPRP